MIFRFFKFRKEIEELRAENARLVEMIEQERNVMHALREKDIKEIELLKKKITND